MPNNKRRAPLIRNKSERALFNTFEARQYEYRVLRSLVEQGRGLERYLDALPNHHLAIVDLDLQTLHDELCKILPTLEQSFASYEDYFAKLAEFLVHGVVDSTTIESLPEQ